MPARMAAARLRSSRSTWKVRPEGFKLPVRLMAQAGVVGRAKRRARAKAGIVPGRRLASPSRPTLPPIRSRPLLIVGCGDVGTRLLKQLQLGGSRRAPVIVLTSSPERLPALRALGVRPMLGNLDEPATLRRVAHLEHRVLHLAPPPAAGTQDRRTQALIHALRRAGAPVRRWVYGSTSGVYGDCGGAWVTETRPVNPMTDRARRRVDAERQVQAWTKEAGVSSVILRIPGIYALDRAGGDPRQRVLQGSPVLRPEDDVYTNHIHADDLARACWRALMRPVVPRVCHVSDDTRLPMGDYFDRVADLAGLPRPPRLSRADAAQRLSPMTLSFLSESRQLDNRRLKAVLGLRLRYPTIETAFLPSEPEGRKVV